MKRNTIIRAYTRRYSDTGQCKAYIEWSDGTRMRKKQGKKYSEACTWRLIGEMPNGVRSLQVQPPAPPLDCDLVFSSLPGDIARETESSFAAAGYPVISNSSAFRMDEDVPLLIPEVNHQHLDLLARQRQRCPTSGLTGTLWADIFHTPRLDHRGLA